MSEKEKHLADISADSSDPSSIPDGPETGGDLPPELKSIEAELAALLPRTDRLDRERLIFLAGRESAMAAAPTRRLVWPVAFSAMTTVAAVLAMMLIARPEPEPIVRIVKVPVETPQQPDVPNVHQPEPGAGPAFDERKPADGPADVRWADPQRRQLWKWLAWIGAPQPQRNDRIAAVGRLSYPAMLDRLSGGGLDGFPSAKRDGRVEQVATPVPYHQLLEQVLPDTRSGRRS